ncbi:MAG: tRNA 2-thiouridine(34) synthase MnmA [Planctomycetota bacterium]|nr:tRNA 2-thiouridine(34) synthase MnmA [Planctomycetota bacterium]
MSRSERVLLAMSGGVDSSVAAHLLVQQGYEVVGAFMRHGERHVACDVVEDSSNEPANLRKNSLPILPSPGSSKQGCCSAADAIDAQRVADQIDIPFYSLDLQHDFQRLIGYFVDEYSAGRTPNPCVMCNNWLKFGKLFEFANSIDATYVATGHYAQIVADDGAAVSSNGGVAPMGVGLARGKDRRKDQSYVLFGISRSNLSRVLLPLGQFHKPEIRKMADDFGLRVANKPDSQEICFVAPGQHSQFVRSQTGRQSQGEIVDLTGRVLGVHEGIEGFTIGQRKGLRVALGEPHYVVRIDAEKRQVVLGTLDALACSNLAARGMNWLVEPPQERFSCQAQIRYNSAAIECVVSPVPGNRALVEFSRSAYGVAPGQAVVLYRGDRVLGGGWIESSG